MVFQCIYCGMKPDSSNNVTLHKFPSNEETSKIWLEQMGLPDLKISKNMRLCSQHFVATALKQNKRYTTLTNDAVPTIFNEQYKNSCVYCTANKISCDRQFHRFPLHDDILTTQWLTNMDMKEFRPTCQSLLCSSHFEDSCYRPNTGRSGRRIKLKAIPTIFSNAPPSTFAGTYVTCELAMDIGSLKKEDGMMDDMHYMFKTADTEVTCELPIDTGSIKKEDDIMNGTDVTCELAMDIGSIKKEDDIMNENRVASREDPTIPFTPKTALRILEQDHNYTSSPRSTRKSLARVKKQLVLARSQIKKKNQKIKRLQNKVVTLKHIVKDLRQRKSIPESGLA